MTPLPEGGLKADKAYAGGMRNGLDGERGNCGNRSKRLACRPDDA